MISLGQAALFGQELLAYRDTESMARRKVRFFDHFASERLPVGMFTDDMIRAGEEGLIWTEENIAAYSKDPIGFIKEYLDDETARPNMSVKLRKGAEDIAAYLATFSSE